MGGDQRWQGQCSKRDGMEACMDEAVARAIPWWMPVDQSCLMKCTCTGEVWQELSRCPRQSISRGAQEMWWGEAWGRQWWWSMPGVLVQAGKEEMRSREKKGKQSDIV